jgi:hypothetical protein
MHKHKTYIQSFLAFPLDPNNGMIHRGVAGKNYMLKSTIHRHSCFDHRWISPTPAWVSPTKFFMTILEVSIRKMVVF